MASMEMLKRRKEDAMELALLLYDIYKESQASAKITSGQNNAQTTPKD